MKKYLIRNRFASKCAHCEQSVRVGELVWWGKNQGIVQRDCYLDFEESGTHKHKGQQDADISQGIQDWEDYKFNRNTFGSDYAEAVEFQNDLNRVS